MGRLMCIPIVSGRLVGFFRCTKNRSITNGLHRARVLLRLPYQSTGLGNIFFVSRIKFEKFAFISTHPSGGVQRKVLYADYSLSNPR
jgi:hypothetical protein